MSQAIQIAIDQVVNPNSELVSAALISVNTYADYNEGNTLTYVSRIIPLNQITTILTGGTTNGTANTEFTFSILVNGVSIVSIDQTTLKPNGVAYTQSEAAQINSVISALYGEI